jgi:multiple sugar transport system permease protein
MQTSFGKTKAISHKRRFRVGFLEVVVALTLLFYTVVLILPLIFSFYYSLTNLNPLYANTKFIGLSNYFDLLDDRSFGRSLVNTVQFAVALTIIANVGGLLLALGMNRRGALYATMRTILFIPYALAPIVVGLLWTMYLNDRGLVNTILYDQLGLIPRRIPWLGEPRFAFATVVFVVVWQWMGFCMVIFLAALQSIPKELLDAAKVDGANGWQRFRNVTWPLISPAVTITVTLILIGAFKLYDQILVLTKGGPGGATETMAYYVVRIGLTGNQTGYATAIAVILFVMMAITSIIVTRYLRSREVEF